MAIQEETGGSRLREALRDDDHGVVAWEDNRLLQRERVLAEPTREGPTVEPTLDIPRNGRLRLVNYARVLERAGVRPVNLIDTRPVRGGRSRRAAEGLPDEERDEKDGKYRQAPNSRPRTTTQRCSCRASSWRRGRQRRAMVGPGSPVPPSEGATLGVPPWRRRRRVSHALRLGQTRAVSVTTVVTLRCGVPWACLGPRHEGVLSGLAAGPFFQETSGFWGKAEGAPSVFQTDGAGSIPVIPSNFPALTRHFLRPRGLCLDRPLRVPWLVSQNEFSPGCSVPVLRRTTSRRST